MDGVFSGRDTWAEVAQVEMFALSELKSCVVRGREVLLLMHSSRWGEA